MKEDEINRALWEYYRTVTEEARATGTARIKIVVSTVMVIAVFLTFIGLILTQIDKMIGIIIIGIVIFIIFILFTGYLIFLNHIFELKFNEIAMNIEKLQRDMLFGKIDETEMKERFQKIYPYLNKYEFMHERKKTK